MNSFCKGINLLGLGNKESVILEPFFEEEKDNMVITDQSNEFIYKHLSFVHNLGVLIPFTPFEPEVLTTIRAFEIFPNRCAFIRYFEIFSNRWDFIREFKIICSFLEVTHTIGVLYSLHGTKTLTRGGWVTLVGLSRDGSFYPSLK